MYPRTCDEQAWLGHIACLCDSIVLPDRHNSNQTVLETDCHIHPYVREMPVSAYCLFPTEYKRLQTILGVIERAATAVIAETGMDMKIFATVALVGWCGLKPRNNVNYG